MNNYLHSRRRLFVMSAPAGSGKTTLAHMLIQDLSHVVRAITCTTRQARSGEIEGVDYFFLSQSQFLQKQQDGAFLESAVVFGSYYGTYQAHVEMLLQQGKHVLLVIDVQGALAVKKKFSDAVLIFITPPSLEVLKERLISRNKDSIESIELRLQAAQHELEMISHYDYHILNNDLSTAYQILKSIVIAEENRIRPA